MLCGKGPEGVQWSHSPFPVFLHRMNLEGFDILEQLGHGGMATVYRARQRSLDREVAIKVFAPRFEPTPEDREQFQNEARVAARLKHPGLVQVYDAVFSGEMYCFVMELVRGYTVSAWSERKGRLDERQILDVADCVADALDYAWRQHGVIHRDIKPENLMVDADGTVKVLDLGLCKTAQAVMQQSGTEDQVYGTPQYISPEQAIGQSDLDCRTDIYSLGATMYFLSTGQLLFPGRPDAEVMDMQVRSKAPNPGSINPELSPAFCSLLEKMLCKDRSRRQEDWKAVRRDIEAVRQGLPLVSGNPVPGASSVESAPPPAPPADAKPRRRIPRTVRRRNIPLRLAEASATGTPATALPAQPPPRKSSVFPVVLLLVAILAAGGLFAVTLANRREAAKANARQTALGEARQALSRVDESPSDLARIDAAEALYRELRERHPTFVREADAALADLAARREAVRAAQSRARFDSLLAEANALADADDFERAISTLLAYRGEDAAEFAAERDRAVAAFEERRRRRNEEAARREEEERTRQAEAEQAARIAQESARIADQTLSALEERGATYAATILEDQEESHPEIFAPGGECAALRDLVRGILAAQERFDRSFRPDTVLSVELRNGTTFRGRLIKVDRARDELVFVSTTPQGLDFNRPIAFRDLAPRELLSRLGAEQDPGTRFVRVRLFRRYDLPIPSPTFLDDQCRDFPSRVREVALARPTP